MARAAARSRSTRDARTSAVEAGRYRSARKRLAWLGSSGRSTGQRYRRTVPGRIRETRTFPQQGRQGARGGPGDVSIRHSSVRDRTLSLRYIRDRCASTVRNPMNSSAATSELVRPAATSSPTRCSAAVSPGPAPLGVERVPSLASSSQTRACHGGAPSRSKIARAAWKHTRALCLCRDRR